MIEVNIVDKNYSLTAFEYFDYLGDRAALSMEKDGVHNALVFDYKNDELFAITGNVLNNHIYPKSIGTPPLITKLLLKFVQVYFDVYTILLDAWQTV